MPILDCLVTMERLLRRADREAEGARLLSEYAPKGHLGFESPALRQYELKEGSHRGPFFIIEKGRWGFEPSKNEAPRWTPHLVRCDIALALHLRSLGYGLAFGRERAVVDAATQAVELYQ